MTFLTNLIHFPGGRASRTEYWVSMLIVIVALGLALLLVGGIIPQVAIALIVLIAGFWYSVVVRRMHDLNMTAWNLLWFIPLSFVPVVGFGAVVIMGLREGNDDDNYYGHSARYR